MSEPDYSQQYCVIGAGSSGLPVLKNFLQAGIPVGCVERNHDVGGIWNVEQPGSSVYQSAHLISSKRLTEYHDFPIPDEFPEFISHRQAAEYFKSYAQAFDLYSKIEFGTSVERVEPADQGWSVRLSNGQTRRYCGVVIANGHHSVPQWPSYSGHFDGLTLHSCQYKTPDVLQGKRVLVVGAGNSGCDIAVESAQNAAKTFHSLRRGYHYLPKFVYGQPIDAVGEQLHRWRLPLWLRRLFTKRVVHIALGAPETYGLPKPDHKLLESHPIINSQMLYYVGHGRIQPRPEVETLLPDGVRFVDGREEKLDVVVYATGFQISIPFIDPVHLAWKNGRPEMFLNVFPSQHDDLFVAGLIQPDSGLWGLVDDQARLMVKVIQARENKPALAAAFQRWKTEAVHDLSSGIHYVPSARHLLEVEHFGYRRKLRKLIKKMQ